MDLCAVGEAYGRRDEKSGGGGAVGRETEIDREIEYR